MLSARDWVVHVLDILLVAFLIYRLLLIVRGTRAWRILVGVLGFVLALWLSGVLRLNTMHWILDKATLLGPVALVILFLPELRQAIEGVGKIGTGLPNRIAPTPEGAISEGTLESLVEALYALGAERIGALVVIEKGTPLLQVAATGVDLGGTVLSGAFVRTVFYGENPLHDGAVLVRGDLAVAAACRLPLSDNSHLDPNVHMRHRAAVGASEGFDCIVLAVSEERGAVSVAHEGTLRRVETPREMRHFLNLELRGVDLEPPVPEPAPERPARRRRGRPSRPVVTDPIEEETAA